MLHVDRSRVHRSDLRNSDEMQKKKILLKHKGRYEGFQWERLSINLYILSIVDSFYLQRTGTQSCRGKEDNKVVGGYNRTSKVIDSILHHCGVS